MRSGRLVVCRILEGLASFFLSLGAQYFSSRVKRDGKGFEVYVESDYEEGHQKELEEMTRLLRMPRAPEMEEYYWSLSGDVSTGQELYLVGILTDSVSIEHHEEERWIQVTLSLHMD